MIVLTNCLTKIADEGGMKVANSLTRRIKAADPSVTVVSCGSENTDCDVHIPTNKLLMNAKLAKYLLRRREPVLFMPAYARALAMTVRIFILSLFARWGLKVLIVMSTPITGLPRLLLKMSGAQVLCLSEESCQTFRDAIGERASHLCTGVDTARFVPADKARKLELRRKYGLPEDKPIVLHVGHMKEGRNIGQMMKIDPCYHAVLAVSTMTAEFEDKELRERLLTRQELTLFDQHIPCIEELYQLSDVYFFPVTARHNCIDVPLSALEAAACGLPVVATPYGELKALLDKEGFFRIDSFEAEKINALLDQAAASGRNGREAVIPYDWENSVQTLLAGFRRNE